ncbi:hypothetical protein P3X46_007355 [Hevea brasiliensis]|uniref:DUF761 domain-containing protein n=1 Tax=Hevea brasiliensis TaxID=3981 RepID=A0ABQ9MT94_HEVBR|nr:uncharacterized protein LOC110653045 [Hevea brasiliensis]KAJ9183512.1 hypothetical protein P3X46_007355 [Hevea brasiliensis]
MEPSSTLVAKKLSSMIRVALFMIQKGISKSKLMLDLHLIMKRGKILGKALNDLIIEHQTALSCRSHDLHMSFVSPAVAVGCRPHDVHMSFVSPREYEFSCSSSPSYRPYNRFQANGRRTHSNQRKHKGYYQHTRYNAPPYTWNDVESEGGDVTEGSVNLAGGGFGWSPLVRQVRITDSPFSLRDSSDREDCVVDIEAEKFIDRFYRELRLQKRVAAREAANNMI